MDWHRITTRIGQGDMKAFGEYYDQMFELMYREARRLLRTDESTALDVVHDAMLKAGRCIKPLANQQAVEAWSVVVVKSVAYDWLRRRKAEFLSKQSLESLPDRNDQDDSDPASSALAVQAREVWLAEQLEKLPRDLRQLVDWRYRWGWTLEQIGRQLGLKPGCVDGRLRRLVERLRASAAEQQIN